MLPMIEKLEPILQPALQALGLELWGAEWVLSGRPILRIYVEAPGGVSLEACAKASQQIATALDVEQTIDSPYNLEVSSPGLERTLYSLAHYQRFLNSLVWIRLRQPQEGRRHFTGLLMAVDPLGTITVDLSEESKQITVKWQDIEKSHLVVPQDMKRQRS